MSEYKLRPYQIEAKEAVEKEWANGNKKTLLVMATGCHMKGEKLLMADGSIKAVEDITNNDFLMGDDGLPRTILKMHNGIDDIYKVTPSKGDPFYISSEHTLTLVDSKDNYIDVPLKEFLSWRKTKRNKYYLKRSNPIYNFLDHGSITKEDGINPYVLGILVNNSTIKEIKKSTSIRVALRPQKTKEFFEKWCNMHGLLIVKNIKNNDNDFSYYIKKDENTKENILVELAKKYGIVNVKCSESFIPDEIKYAPYDERIQFLAATIDLCGSCAGSGYQITKKSTKFTDDLIFLARSCGFSAYKHVSIKNAGKPNETSVNVIHIGGNFGIVPTLEKYNSNILALDVLKTKFEIVPFRKDEYFGFTVDGNNRYLLADFTISHNCGKTVVFSNIIKDAIEKNGHKVLVIAHREELLLQAKEKLESMTGLEVAIEKGQNKAYETNAKIIVASVQTIQGKNRLNKYDRNEFGTIVVDEAHHILANGYQKVMEYFDENANVLGVTATADRGDKRGLGIYFDSIAYEYGLAQAIQEGYLVPLKAMTIPLSLDISNVKTSQGDYQIGQLGNAIDPYLDEIAQKISNICKNMKTLVFLPTVETAKKMKEKLIKYGMKAEEIDGTTKNRADILKDFKNGDYNILTNPILLCLDEKTEVLTSSGFKGINDISWDDEIANWNFDNSIFFAKPKNIIKRDLEKDENMVSVESQMINFRVTDKHKLVCLNSARTKYIKKEANKVTIRDIFPTCGIAEPKKFVLSDKNTKEYIPTRREISQEKYNLKHREKYSEEDAVIEARKRIKERKSLRYLNPEELSLAQCKFIGFYLAEGYTQKLIRGGVEFTFTQAESFPKIIEWIDNVLKKMGVHYLKKYKKIDKKKSSNRNNYFRYSLCRGTGFGSQARKGLYSIEPYLKRNGTELFWGLNEKQFDALLEGYWYGDGDHKQALNGFPKSIHLSETSKELIELFCAIGSCRGWRCSMFVRKPRKPNHSIQYALSMQKGMKRHMSEVTKVNNEKYKKEKVWCVTTDSGNIVTRRNGRVMVMGNCEGYDEPSTNCMVMLRPTQIRSLYTQAVGRISRLYPGKTEGLILDFLWLTERHNLIKPASLFSDDPEVIDIAAKKVDASAEPLDLMETTKKSRAEMVANRERSLKETLDAQRRKQAQYVDPLQFAVSVESEEILSYEAITRADKKKPTQEQIEWLFKHGINADEIKDYGQARNIIRSLKERYAKSLSTPKQIRFLEKRGFRRVGLWSFSAASALISEISENSWMIPRHIDPKTYVPKI